MDSLSRLGGSSTDTTLLLGAALNGVDSGRLSFDDIRKGLVANGPLAFILGIPLGAERGTCKAKLLEATKLYLMDKSDDDAGQILHQLLLLLRLTFIVPISIAGQ